ncbi:MAG: MtrB/PioB family outer membrane beta-barrel protein [Rhodocyclaceae bacterium]|nr:MtrB/PioB family outer membrane beta-barrel protein [Rhodocyclaceae bacterium]
MKASKMSKYFIPCLTVLAASISQAYASDESANVVSGEVTPKLIYFNYNGGPGGGSPQYLQAFGSERGWTGNDNSGFYADLDVNLKIGDYFSLERQGFGRDSHRGNIQGGNSNIGVSGYYSHHRSGSHGLDYLNRPGTANNPVDPAYFTNTAHTNTGFLARFNDDSPPNVDYHIERTNYGVKVKFKPELLGKGTSLSLDFDGYKRDGNKFATWVAGNSDFTNGPAAVPNNDPATTGIRTPHRWRGYEKQVDETMGRFTLSFTAAPSGLFQFAYDGSLEKFNNQARTLMMEDVVNLTNGVTVTSPGDWAMHYVPDSTLMTNNFRLSKTFGTTAVAAGYGMSRLKQDSQSEPQAAAGFRGKVTTDNAFFNINHRFTPSVSLEAHVKYFKRDNQSTEAPTAIVDRNVRDEWGVRINQLETLDYGLAATFRGLPAKSSLTAGWRHLDTDRDLQWNYLTATANIGQWPTTSVYGDNTKSDEFYLKWSARPVKDMTLRLTPSWVRASKTGLVSEAEDSFNLKAGLGYALSNQTHLNAYYNYKDKKNGDQSFIDTNKPTNGPILLGPEYQQKADDTFHAAGLSLNYAPSEWVNLSGSLDWSQNDFETYFFGTNLRRFETNIVFDPRGASAYKVDTLSLTLNGDYQPTDLLKLRASYTWSDTSGDLRTTSTATAGAYEVNDKIDNILHSLTFGADYALKNKLTLKGAYVYDRYKDKAFSNFNGSHHTLMMGVSVGF